MGWRLFGTSITSGPWERAVSGILRVPILGNWNEPIPGSKVQNTGGQRVQRGRPWIPSGST